MSTAFLISSLMHSRTQAHVFHLRTTSFAAHKALEGYYTGIVPLMDQYAEAYQGRYGLISGYTIGKPLNQNPMRAKSYFLGLAKVIQKSKIPKGDTYLLNIRDSIYQLVYQTLYMLSLDTTNNNTTRNKNGNGPLSRTISRPKRNTR